MAPVISPPPNLAERKAWNEAYDRLTSFLDTLFVGDRTHVARLTLALLDRARDAHRLDPAQAPTKLVMEMAQKDLSDWLATNLSEQDKAPSQIVADGCIALLLTRVFQVAPSSFLDGPLPENLRQALREKMLVAGPDLEISRMTPRHLDYGPMLDIARQTWHRSNLRAFLLAVSFWTAVYFFFYWWLSTALL